MQSAEPSGIDFLCASQGLSSQGSTQAPDGKESCTCWTGLETHRAASLSHLSAAFPRLPLPSLAQSKRVCWTQILEREEGGGKGTEKVKKDGNEEEKNRSLVKKPKKFLCRSYIPTLVCVAQLVGASPHTPRGWGFDSWSGHTPRGWTLNPWLGCMLRGGNQSMFLSLSLALSLSSQYTYIFLKFFKYLYSLWRKVRGQNIRWKPPMTPPSLIHWFVHFSHKHLLRSYSHQEP